jgi:hypothetical protein
MTEERKLHSLKFTNSDAIPKIVEVFCDHASVASIMAWYGAYYSGDRYWVHLDGQWVEKDQNGEIVPPLPAPPEG